jgi:hypothetical protein
LWHGVEQFGRPVVGDGLGGDEFGVPGRCLGPLLFQFGVPLADALPVAALCRSFGSVSSSSAMRASWRVVISFSTRPAASTARACCSA